MKRYLLLFAALCMVTAGHAQKKNFSYKFYGQVRGDLFYNSRANAEIVDGLFHLYPKDKNLDADGNDLNATANGSFYLLYSRLGVDVTGPNIGKAVTTAKLEADFRGSGSNWAVLRIRHAYINLDWGKSAVLVGQTWHPLFGDVSPQMLNLSTGAPFQPFNRSPQIRYQYKANSRVQLTASVLWQLQYLSSGPISKTAIMAQLADAVKKAGSRRRREQNRARLKEGEMDQIKVPYGAGRGALGMASAEQRLLAAMLREPGYINKVSAQLRPEQFLQPQQKELYEAMLRCKEQGVEVSLATLRAFVSEEALNELSRLAAQYSDVNCTPEDIKLYLERIARGTPVASRAASMSTNDIEQYLQSMREQKQGTADAEDSV